MAGRPKQFSNAAEKQKDYRDRKKAQIIASEMALTLLQETEEKKVTLLNCANYWRLKGNKITIDMWGRTVQLKADGWPRGTIESLLMNHMIRTGEVRFVKKEIMNDVYEFAPDVLECLHDDTAEFS